MENSGMDELTYGSVIAYLKKYISQTLEGQGALQGKSSYQIAVQNGFTGTEQQWLASLIGEDGKTPLLRVDDGVLQYKYPSDTNWNDLFNFSYKHTQNIASSTWVIAHNLGEQSVSVQVNDFTGNLLLPEIVYTSINVITLLFAKPVQGTAKITR